MNGKDLLIWIKMPGRIEFLSRLPDSLESGGRGGFNPCGMWDFIVDSKNFAWCGMQFYLAREAAESFELANPDIDKSIVRIKKISEIYQDQNSLDIFARNGTSHIIQVMWSEAKESEELPAMEFTDTWYAVVPEGKNATQERFGTSQQFCAIGVLDFQSKLRRTGLEFPRTFVCSIADGSV